MAFLRVLLMALVAFGLVSCESLNSSPKPPSKKLSSMPHNLPAAWEGQAGLPGMMGGQY